MRGSLVGTNQDRRPPLHDHRIEDREVVNERFVGPFAGRVSRQAIGLVGGRAEAGGCGGEAQVGKDLPEDRMDSAVRLVRTGGVRMVSATTSPGDLDDQFHLVEHVVCPDSVC